MGNRNGQRPADQSIWSSTHAGRDRQRGPRMWGYREMAVAKAIGEEVRRIIAGMDMSTYDLARSVNVSQPQISYYLNGKDQLTLAVLFDLEEVLGLEAGHLLGVALSARNTAQDEFFPPDKERA